MTTKETTANLQQILQLVRETIHGNEPQLKKELREQHKEWERRKQPWSPETSALFDTQYELALALVHLANAGSAFATRALILEPEPQKEVPRVEKKHPMTTKGISTNLQQAQQLIKPVLETLTALLREEMQEKEDEHEPDESQKPETLYAFDAANLTARALSDLDMAESAFNERLKILEPESTQGPPYEKEIAHPKGTKHELDRPDQEDKLL